MGLLTKLRPKKYNLGLALSGGGARGFVHLGCAKAFYEKGYKFDIISGTSMGAMVGCMLADGYHPKELLTLLTPDILSSFVRTSVRKKSIMNMRGGYAFLKKHLRHKKIEDLPTPFIAVATNLNEGRAAYFEKGDIIEAVMASASIPVVFPTTIIGNCQYIDGGVLNNLPVRCIRDKCKKVFGIHANPEELGLYQGEVQGLLQIAERSFYLAMLGNVIPDKALCDIFIEPKPLSKYGLMDFEKMTEIVHIGYKATQEILNENDKAKKK